MKKKILLSFLISLFVSIGVAVVVESRGQLIVPLKTKGTNFVLNLNSQNISDRDSSYDGEISASIQTTDRNVIEFKSSNVISNNSGWQTILPHGYFYNPLNESINHNKISGIASIRFDSNEDKTLTLHYGYFLDNSGIVYSNEKELSPNVEYQLGNLSPSYLYIKNNNNENVNISNFSITYSCQSIAYPKQDLNILMIGNSFADDTVFYTERIAASYGINLHLYDAYIAGCTINTHYTNIVNDNATYSMRNIINGEWNYQDNMTLTNIINSHTWDIITFQQASAEIGRSNSYSNLANLVSSVRSLVGESPKFYWYQTWAYDSDYHDYYDYFSYFNNDQIAMYNAINSCYSSQVAPLGIFDKIVPAGTAVQNMRTSYMKETFTRDGKHMSSVHGRYLLGLNFLSSVYDVDLNMSPCSYLPGEVDPSFKNVAYESVKNAGKNPLNCTNSAYVNRNIGNYDLSQYTEIDAELVGCSYWNSTDGSNYNKRQSNVKDSSNYYTSTKRFTSESLPVGSLVVVDDSFGFCPEAWVSDSAQGTRPAERYDNVLEIDSSFFNGYLYRAFNIFKAGKTELKGQYDQIFDGFHIYVPNNLINNSMTIKDANPYYSSDKTIFQNNYKNIDAYERLHLDPITGFYKCDSYYELTNSYVDDTAKKFVCSRPFYSARNDLPEKTVIICDSGYQWRSDCWGDHGSYSPRPGNNSAPFTCLTSSFWEGFRRRTFNVSSTSSSYVNQNYVSFMQHVRIYVPVSDDTDLEKLDTVTMSALGYATMNSTFASIYGKSEIPFLITLHGDAIDRVTVKVDGSDVGATNYSYNKMTGAISINTTGSVSGYTYGTISGVVDPNAGTISNIGINGSLSSFITINGNITCAESWHDRCNYSTNSASQAVWQRWYMSGSWTANSGTGEWTTSNSSYLLDNDYSMGLRIANNSYKKTRFTLVNDFNGGSGFTPKGISIWLYNPNGAIYSSFRIYVYQTASSMSNGHAVPSSSYSEAYNTSDIGQNTWKNIQLGLNYGVIYNISFYFETNNSNTTYVYLGHVSFY